MRRKPNRTTQAIVLCLALLRHASSASAQQTPHDYPIAITMGLRGGSYGPVTEAEAADALSGNLVPFLKARFLTAEIPAQKAYIAGALVQLCEKDSTYWNYLVDYARPALENEAPDWKPRSVKGDGGTLVQSPEFLAWEKAHGAAAAKDLEELPSRIRMLGTAEDPRGIPLLREALKSRQFDIVEAAALGLAEIHDTDSIPLILDACRRAPPEAAPGIAESLKYFDDPRARAGAALYAPGQPTPLDHLRRGEAASFWYDQVAEAHQVEAIPLLKERYAQLPETLDIPHPEDAEQLADKAHLASVLVRLGLKNGAYWDYLMAQATRAIERGIPYPAEFDAEGNPTGTSIALDAWVKAHNVPAASVVEEAEYTDLVMVGALAAASDTRAIPLLRQALQAPNPLIQTAGASGLAQLEDTASIPLIVEACRKTSATLAANIAIFSLVRFKDPAARAAAAEFISAAQLKMIADQQPPPASPKPTAP